jgi:hypothetical protein
MFTNRPLLFLGCSLEHDRTVDVLKQVHQRLPGLRHYAVLAAHHSVRRREQRARDLGLMGISPLWFAPEQWGEIDQLLRGLVERSSTRLLRPVRLVRPACPPEKHPTIDQDSQAALRRFAEAVGVPARLPKGPVVEQQTMERIGAALDEGRLSFFLGAAVSVGSLPLGDEFYDGLVEAFDVPHLGGGRAEVAAFVVSRFGAQALWRKTREAVTRPAEPGLGHRILAALPGLLRARGRTETGALWVFTTNYDSLMEDALDAAGEPFHLLYYMGGIVANNTGLFAVRSPDGSERVIEQPDHIRSLEEGASTVVVKLNGGVLYDSSIEESAAVATGHFEQLAARIPDALPDVVRRALWKRSLLFLGHGLAEPDVSAIIRYAAPGDGTSTSWAVQRLLAEEEVERRRSFNEQARYLSRLGVEVVVADLEHFLLQFHQHLSKY